MRYAIAHFVSKYPVNNTRLIVYFYIISCIQRDFANIDVLNKTLLRMDKLKIIVNAMFFYNYRVMQNDYRDFMNLFVNTTSTITAILDIETLKVLF